MNKLAYLLLAAFLILAGCSFGPDHLPALYQQRDHYEQIIDQILARMSVDKEWWASLSPEQRRYWKEYLERVRLEEKERAFNAIGSLTEGLSTLEPWGAETGLLESPGTSRHGR